MHINIYKHTYIYIYINVSIFFRSLFFTTARMDNMVASFPSNLVSRVKTRIVFYASLGSETFNPRQQRLT